MIVCSLGYGYVAKYVLKELSSMGVLGLGVSSKKEIFDYLKLDEWKNKAGSYAIQGFAASFIDFISGSYTSAVGLPLEKLYTILSNNGLI